MKASELIIKLTQQIAWCGDKELEILIQDDPNEGWSDDNIKHVFTPVTASGFDSDKIKILGY